MSTSSVHNFGTEIDMDLRFFALVHKYSLVLDSIRIEKVIFFRFLGGGPPLIQIFWINGNAIREFVFTIL